MDLVDTFGTIWQVRWRVVLLGVVSALVAVLIAFNVSLAPLRLTPRALQFGNARGLVMVDSQHSALADASVPISNLYLLAEQMAGFVQSDAVLGPVARSIGATPDQIGVQLQLVQNLPRTQVYTREEQVGVQLLNQKRRYLLLVRNDQGTSVIQLYAQAPTGGMAARMVSAATDALSRYASAQAAAEGVPSGDHVIVRKLGPIASGTVDRGASRDAAILGGIVLWIVLTIALLTLRRLRWRRMRLAAQDGSL